MKCLIPQIIIPASIDVVKYLQKDYPCKECLKECKAVWVTMEQLEKVSDNMDEKLSIEYCCLIILSRKFDIGRICFSAGDIHTLNDCDGCIHFHDAIVK